MSDINTITANVTAIVRDAGGKISSNDYARIIQAALTRYSNDRPDALVVDVRGNGSHDYALPSGCNEGFSEVLSIEFPIGQVPPVFLNDAIDDAWTIYQSPTGKLLRLLYVEPTAAEQFRVAISIPRTDETILDMDVDAFCNLAASFCLEELATFYTNTSDPTIMADSVNYRSKGQEFATRAKRLLQLYKEHLGIKDTDITLPAFGVKSLQENYPMGIDRLTHPRWARRRR